MREAAHDHTPQDRAEESIEQADEGMATSQAHEMTPTTLLEGQSPTEPTQSPNTAAGRSARRGEKTAMPGQVELASDYQDAQYAWQDIVPVFQQSTNASLEESKYYSALVGGNLPKAVATYFEEKLLATPESATNIWQQKAEAKEPKVRTLLECALEAHGAKPKSVRRSGDIAVVLDVKDLSKTCLVCLEDAAEVSPLFGDLVAVKDTDKASVFGIRCLLILQKKPEGEAAMPTLKRMNLHVMHEDCVDDFYTQTTETGTIAATSSENVDDQEGDGQMIKVEANRQDAMIHEQRQTRSSMAQPTDWAGVYETFFRIVARFRPACLGLPLDDIEAALPKIEGVARVAKHYKASAVECPVKQELERMYLKDQQLWRAIAKDAARWLMIGYLLESRLMFEEAFKHVVGAYPQWPWATRSADFEAVVPASVVAAIRSSSKDLLLRCLKVEQELLCLTLSGTVQCKGGTVAGGAMVSQHVDPVRYNTANIFRDWIATHPIENRN